MADEKVVDKNSSELPYHNAETEKIATKRAKELEKKDAPAAA